MSPDGRTLLLVFNGHDTILNNVFNVLGLTDKVEVLALEAGGVSLEHGAVLVFDLVAGSNGGDQSGDVRVLGNAILELAV